MKKTRVARVNEVEGQKPRLLKKLGYDYDCGIDKKGICELNLIKYDF